MGKILIFPDPVERETPEPNAEVYACRCLCVSWYLLGDNTVACTACGSSAVNLRTHKLDSGKPAA